MEDNIKFAVEEYQCPGCISGSNTSCYKKSNNSVSCGCHMAGTAILSQGKIFLGMPKDFNRLGCSFGSEQQLKIEIHEKFNEEEVWMGDHPMGKFNVVCWKYLNEHGHTLVRGVRPRKNEPFLHIFLEDCREKIGGVEITKEEIEKMD
jgi:hypothetical protein